MLVTFSSPAHGDVTMFGDVAIRLLNMMGRSDTVPSALYAEDVQAALERLKVAGCVRATNPEAEHDSRGRGRRRNREHFASGPRH